MWLYMSENSLTSPPAKPRKQPDHAAADAQGVGDVADDEVPRLVAGVDLAVQVLAGAGGREERARVARRLDRRADGEELHQAAERA